MFRVIHDVRAILRKGHVRAQMLERKLGAGIDGEARAMLESVLASQRELDQLMGRLAAYADAGRSAPEEWMKLDTVILGAKLHVKAALEKAGGIISSENTEGVRVPSALQAALVELFTNAIRFRRDDEPLRIAISARASGSGALIRIADNGRGWDAGDSEKMFEPLRKLEAHPEGFGLGLAIARRIVEFAGGGMRAEARADGGDFLIDMPGER